MAHRIRLRHPWMRDDLIGVDPRAGEGQGDNDGETQSPAWHQVAFTRRFNRPTGLTAEDRLGIEMSGHLGQIVAVQLNEQGLRFDPTDEVLRVSLDTAIQDHNEFRIVLRRDGRVPELGEVNLWIESVE